VGILVWYEGESVSAHLNIIVRFVLINRAGRYLTPRKPTVFRHPAPLFKGAGLPSSTGKLEFSRPLSSSILPTPPSLHSVRVGRIELPSYPWQGYILPLNYTRRFNYQKLTGTRID